MTMTWLEQVQKELDNANARLEILETENAELKRQLAEHEGRSDGEPIYADSISGAIDGSKND